MPCLPRHCEQCTVPSVKYTTHSIKNSISSIIHTFTHFPMSKKRKKKISCLYSVQELWKWVFQISLHLLSRWIICNTSLVLHSFTAITYFLVQFKITVQILLTHSVGGNQYRCTHMHMCTHALVCVCVHDTPQQVLKDFSHNCNRSKPFLKKMLTYISASHMSIK